ncbi:uncharacterized protein LTR77_005977 [Saxophila tyrrhenica]|uniref:Uncharacterized protein n=1 Tax=Saxophila tyrrhenica TaxID=1690608 RepID=A0AAV9P6M0_9PEZI|nr:hypothetical protein LTR77_005977 [Saxophila tyrrhenica]
MDARAGLCSPSESTRPRRQKARDFPFRATQEADEPTKALLRQREDLRHAVADSSIKDVVRLYDELEDKSIFNRHDFRLIVQCLHQHCRRLNPYLADPKRHREETDTLATFGERLVEDLKQGIVEPNKLAHVHLLGLFKEIGHRDSGGNFWEWLQAQDDSFIDHDVYGAAIELLAVSGTPLTDLEELYQEALTRFPGNFVAYHLSPNAIVPNREEAVRLPGIPISLLQGILTARLLHGDTRNAYLALDTALRLYPDQVPSRFFTLFVEERPLIEAYTVVAIACRAGIYLPGSLMKKCQSALRAHQGLGKLPSALIHPMIVRAQLSLLHMYRGAGNVFTTNMLSELIMSVSSLGLVKGLRAAPESQRRQCLAPIVRIIRHILTIAARLGVRPGIAAFNRIINELGPYSKELVGRALADAKGMGLEPTHVTRRSIMVAAGKLGDGEMLMATWRLVVQARNNADQKPDLVDWACFIISARDTKCFAFARQEFEAHRQTMSPEEQHRIDSMLESKDEGLPDFDSLRALDLETMLSQLSALQNDLHVFDERTKDCPVHQDFSSQKLPMTMLRPESGNPVPDKVQRTLYDELTTEQPKTGPADLGHSGTESIEQPQPTAEAALSAAPIGAPHRKSPTNIPLGTLRYENWKTMNWLLEQSAANDREHHRLVDEAIAAGTAPPAHNASLGLNRVNDLGTYGLSDTMGDERKPDSQRAMSEEEVKAWREKVLALRGRTV